MGVAFNIVKWFVFVLNITCLFLGIADICVNAMAVDAAQPGTDAHTFFILAILLCSLLCLTTVIGCYGVFSEVFVINVIYSIFILALMIIQYLQIRSFHPNEFYFNNLQELESAWRLVETKPKYMDVIQSDFYCCGLFNAHDYSYKHLPLPESCYEPSVDAGVGNLTPSSHMINNVGCLETVWKHYKITINRHVLFNWSLLITEVQKFKQTLDATFDNPNAEDPTIASGFLSGHYRTELAKINTSDEKPMETKNCKFQNDSTVAKLQNVFSAKIFK